MSKKAMQTQLCKAFANRTKFIIILFFGGFLPVSDLTKHHQQGWLYLLYLLYMLQTTIF